MIELDREKEREMLSLVTMGILVTEQVRVHIEEEQKNVHSLRVALISTNKL